MKDKSSSPIGLLFFLALFVIVYGSLFPFRFEIPAEMPELWFNGTHSLSFADVLGNIALLIPAGFLGALLAGDKGWRLGPVLLVVLAVAIGVQVVQIFLPQRVPSLSDILFNMIGIAIGYLGARLVSLPKLQGYLSNDHPTLIPLLLLVAFATYQLIPFAPTLDWGLLKTNIKAILRASSDPRVIDGLRNAVYWFTVAVLAERVIGRKNLAQIMVTGLIAVFALRVLIIFNTPSLAQFLGGSLGIGLYFLLPLDRRKQMILAAVLIVTVIIHEGLTPWEARVVPRALSFMPFSGFLTGSMIVNFMALAWKLFLYGGTIYFLSCVGIRRIASVSALALILMMVELAQTQLRSGTPEITDPLIAIILGLVLSRVAHK